MLLLFQPFATRLGTIASLADAAGVLTNDGAGVFSYTGTSLGGNGAADSGKLAKFGTGGQLVAGTFEGFEHRSTALGGDVASLFGDSILYSSFVSGFTVTIAFPVLTANRVVTLPNATGTIALTSDIPATGTMASQNANAVAITGGTIVGLTGLAIRDTSAAFDVTIAAVSSSALTAGRILTIDMLDASHSIKLTGDIDIAGNFSTSGAFNTILAQGANVTLTLPVINTTLAGLGVENAFSAAQTISVNGAASKSPLLLSGVIMTGGTGTTNFPNLLIQPTGATAATTWSTSGTAIGINLDVNAGNFADWKVDGTTNFSVSCTGVLYCKGNANLGDGTLNIASNQVTAFSSSPYRWGTTNSAEIFGNVADTVAIRNSTRAQMLQVYGTYTDASNYVRLAINTTSTTLTIAAETAGTGADNIPINITTAGTGLTDFTNQAASVDAAVVSTHTARMKFGGTEYKILLATP